MFKIFFNIVIYTIIIFKLLINNTYAIKNNKNIILLEKELTKVHLKKKNIKNKINNLSKNILFIAEKKELLDMEIINTQNDIDVTILMTNKISDMIKVKKNEINQIEKQLKVHNIILKKRLRIIYEYGFNKYLEMILMSKNLSDFFNRLEIITRIVSYDKHLLKQYNHLKIKLLHSKSNLDILILKQKNINELLKYKREYIDQQIFKSQNYIKIISKCIKNNKVEYYKADKIEKKIQFEIKKIASLSKGSYIGGFLLWPIPGYKNITSKFGSRFHPILGYNKFHSGIDIPAPKNTLIIAVNGGLIIKATYNIAYGNYIMIDHGGGKVTLYAHMTKFFVKNGDKIKKGSIIGTVGSTGWSTGPHLHFEVIQNGEYINPMRLF